MTARAQGRTLYDILGVAADASQEELRSRYRSLARQFHPDINPVGAERFKEITEAYGVLGDRLKRKEYDEQHDSDELIEALRRVDQERAEAVARSEIGTWTKQFEVAFGMSDGDAATAPLLGRLFVGSKSMLLVVSAIEAIERGLLGQAAFSMRYASISELAVLDGVALVVRYSDQARRYAAVIMFPDADSLHTAQRAVRAAMMQAQAAPSPARGRAYGDPGRSDRASRSTDAPRSDWSASQPSSPRGDSNAPAFQGRTPRSGSGLSSSGADRSGQGVSGWAQLVIAGMVVLGLFAMSGGFDSGSSGGSSSSQTQSTDPDSGASRGGGTSSGDASTNPYTDPWPELKGDPSVIGTCYEEVGGRRLVETSCASPYVDWRVSHFLPTYDSYCPSGAGWTVDGRDYCLARVP